MNFVRHIIILFTSYIESSLHNTLGLILKCRGYQLYIFYYQMRKKSLISFFLHCIAILIPTTTQSQNYFVRFWKRCNGYCKVRISFNRRKCLIFFFFCQCIYRHTGIKINGLQSIYSNDPDFDLRLKQLIAPANINQNTM